MSDIPKARLLLHEIETMTDLLQIRRQVRRAIALMNRVPAIRHARAKPVVITDEIRRRVHELRYSNLTIHEIANRVGLRNNARVSEILHGKR